MVAWLAPTPAPRPRPHRVLISLALLVAALIGPACHDATGPKSLVPAPSFTIVSGNAQTGPAGRELPLPLVAKATTSSGSPIAGLTLFFVVTRGGGKLYAGGGVTDAGGNVQDYWTLGSVAGAQAVQVRTVNPTTGVKKSHGNFTATAVAGPAAIIKMSAGDGQTAFTRALVPIKPAALVTDAFDNPVAGVSVTFAVAGGGGTVSGAAATTNSSGVATVSAWRLGRAPGTNNNLLTATNAGLTGSPVTFTASAKFGMKLVATGLNQSCGLSAANDVYCWGRNANGQVGDNTTIDRHAPVRSAAGLLPPSLALGDLHSCLLLSTGKAHCWGENDAGQLGNASNTDSPTPVAVNGAQTFTQIAAAYYTTCGRTSAGEIWCWGFNEDGEFGNNTTTSSNVPVKTSGGITFSSIYRGNYHTCALTAAGDAWCWGWNGEGELGDGTVTQRLTPTLVTGNHTFTSLELGVKHTCGLVAGGKAYCWGFNLSGQVGNGASGTDANVLSPQPVLGGIAFTRLAAGDSHTCGITSTGVAYCWGYNANGELGVGSTGSTLLVPTLVADGRNFSAISAGASFHTCGVPVGGGNPFCWGSNSFGQLGNGTTISAALPVEVVTPAIP